MPSTIKFGDISKVASDVHKIDADVGGIVLKTKQKTSLQNSNLSMQVDLFSGKDATPTKLTYVWPKPLGFKKAFIDKLEVDRSGKLKLEASSADVFPGLMLELKSDLADINKVATGFTYTDYKETQVKFECKATNPQDFDVESTYTKDKITVGCKLNSGILKGTAPDFGVRFLNGPMFCSLLAKDALKSYTASAAYKANADFHCAASYTHGGKANGNYTVGLSYKGKAKLKLDQTQTVSCSYKHAVSKGFTLLGAASYNASKGPRFGVQLSIE